MPLIPVIEVVVLFVITSVSVKKPAVLLLLKLFVKPAVALLLSKVVVVEINGLLYVLFSVKLAMMLGKVLVYHGFSKLVGVLLVLFESVDDGRFRFDF